MKEWPGEDQGCKVSWAQPSSHLQSYEVWHLSFGQQITHALPTAKFFTPALYPWHRTCYTPTSLAAVMSFKVNRKLFFAFRNLSLFFFFCVAMTKLYWQSEKGFIWLTVQGVQSIMAARSGQPGDRNYCKLVFSSISQSWIPCPQLKLTFPYRLT